MRQRLDLPTVGTLAARIAVVAVAAAQVLDIGYGKGQRPEARSPGEELGVAHAPRIDRLRQMPFQIVLSRYVSKSHNPLLAGIQRPRPQTARTIARTSIRSRRIR